jgi:uncharacterized radical SAM protein YgiQ
MKQRGWDELDFVLVTGDAYVDHHSFAHAIISRVLEDHGYKVGIIAQPDWKTKDDFMRLGRPRLAFLVSPGNMDSMVNHYTVARKPRSRDLYSPGGEMGHRPDRAGIVYCNRIREAYGNVPIVIGGIEASLRRFAHYDYWSDKVRGSILIDSSADLLIFGMGEKQIVGVADNLRDGMEAKYIRQLPGTCYVVDSLDEVYDYVLLPSFDEVRDDKKRYAEAFNEQYDQQDPVRGKTLVQQHGVKYVVQNPPELPLNREELDRVYALPYKKMWHPMYDSLGGIPAIDEVKFSLVSSRGCFGSCSFCAITFHEGRIVQSRSQESLVQEAEEMTHMPDFKGNIHDVGGPTADFRSPACEHQMKVGACRNKQCLWPQPCQNLQVDHSDYLQLLRKLRKIKGVKKVFIRSGLRYDYIMADKDDTFFKELINYHISGQLKVAPEHVDPEVLHYMGKPAGDTYERFRKKFFALTEKAGKKQYLIPYLMSSHPGSTVKSAIKLAEYLRDIGYQPEQVQDFYPTPGTLSTTMFYTGLDPRTMKKVYVPKSNTEKATQRALLQFKNPRNYDLVYKALVSAGREDLIGYGPKCLIRPRNGRKAENDAWSQQKTDRRNTRGPRAADSKGKGPRENTKAPKRSGR